MKLEKDLWIENGYYIDFDEKNQFRIIGPNNHLYCGLIDVPRHKIKIKKIISIGNSKLKVEGNFVDNRLNLYYPAMDDIRTVRMLTGGKTFLETRREYYDRLVPQRINKYKKNGKIHLEFSRHYYLKYYYSCTFVFPPKIKVEKIVKPYAGFKITTHKKSIPVEIVADTNDLKINETCHLDNIFVKKEKNIDFKVFGKNAQKIKYFWQRAGKEIEHLIRWGKTSGDRFGTVFPRDWMEAADIGIHDLTSEARSHMYKCSLKNIDEKGQGWHEDVVGEFKYEFEVSGKEIFDRHMIDIEPHYIIGLEKLPESFLLEKETRDKLKKTALYILNEARKNDFITFEKIQDAKGRKTETYHTTGNWRDSEWAFKKISEIIAPFDVNAVFYPKALKLINKYKKKLNITAKDVGKIAKKWAHKEKGYEFKNADGKIAYALAVYGVKKIGKKIAYKKMRVNHLDESYLYTYRTASQKEIISFCQRLKNPKYFYTEYGPLIIANNNNMGYTDQEYHGLIVWIKQVAFTILGLSKHLKLAITEDWDREVQVLIKETMIEISENILKACVKLNAIPELFYVDSGKPKFFPVSSSKVQLWSAVGIRRIIKKYIELKTDPVYKKIK